MIGKKKIEEVKETRQIGWEKWVDPYGDSLEEEAWPGAFGTFETDEIIERMERIENGESPSEWNEDSYKLLEGKQQVVKKQLKPMKILATPFGIMPLTEWTVPSKIFNFWVAHTNFRMTQEIQDIIDTTDGVETLDIFTPYRWRIGIGKAFQSRIVKERIMQNLNATPLDTTTGED